MAITTTNGYIKLLEEKASHLAEMLSKTKDFTKTNAGGDEDAQAYILLLDKRELLMDRIKAIDNELTASGMTPDSLSGSPDFKDTVKRTQARIKEIITHFLEADKKASQIANGISAGLTNGIKGINNGRTVNQLYQDNAYIGFARFDTSK